MSSVNDRVVVEFVRSLGSPSSSGDAGTSNPTDKASRKRLLARINADEARLSAEGRPWYEVKASLLQESDKAIIRDLSEMGLRFPVPRFIQDLCDHLKVSPSQLTPNSYSSLLALGVLLKFYQAPLSLHLIYNLTQIRQQDVGKFFIRLKPEFGFLKGNPSSHKGRMSRYFFLRRNIREGIAWYCDMSWSEKPTRKAPPLPAQEYDPTPFLKAVSTKCFNAQDLVREDLLCHFGFSRKGVVVEEDLADRIMKSYLLEAYKKQELEVSRGSNPPTEVRPYPTPEEPENPPPEEPANPPPVERTKEKRRKFSSGSDKHSKRKKTSPSVEVDKEAGASQPEQPSLEFSSFIPRPHDKLMKEIEDVRGASDAEKKSLEHKLAVSEASVTRLQEEMKKAGEEAEERIKKVQEDAEASWEKKKEDFLISDEFDRLCSTRALSFFQHGFNGCLPNLGPTDFQRLSILSLS
ncbi:hypothetical protein F511_20382 [Dorcoceras hygrometricum]|uniref:Uncharacterized protein n=1 Tax=Dorcoceras hygrometricum TaxID=472368 RepID=A0A2Z7AME7_9LAMI|nr:hypothetical protein F511_20382 [Dorcoceras hygrometricum]